VVQRLGVVVSRASCNVCALRRLQAKAEGKIGYAMCGECSASYPPLDYVPGPIAVGPGGRVVRSLRMLAMWALRIGSPSMSLVRGEFDPHMPFPCSYPPTLREALRGAWDRMRK
jgi:hypothetical protein